MPWAANTTVAAAPRSRDDRRCGARCDDGTRVSSARDDESGPGSGARSLAGFRRPDGIRLGHHRSCNDVTDRTVKGSTTFKMLLDWGVSEADIRKLFGGEMGATGVTVQDYCTEKGIEFSTVKTALQDLVNAAAP